MADWRHLVSRFHTPRIRLRQVASRNVIARSLTRSILCKWEVKQAPDSEDGYSLFNLIILVDSSNLRVVVPYWLSLA